MGLDILIAAVFALYFFSFVFTFLLLLRLIGVKRTTLISIGVAVLSGILVAVFFWTELIYSISMNTLTFYCFFVFLLYLLSVLVFHRR
jgi:hypothetical protein